MTSDEFVTHIDRYLAFRRSVGFQLRTAECRLRNLARFVDAVGHRGPLTVELVVRWATSNSARGVREKFMAVRQFAKYLLQFDPRTEVPPAGIYRRPPRPLPHIYSDDEIQALLRSAASLATAGTLRPRTLATYFSLLVCTGPRVGEALRLVNDDVDLESGLLLIRETKFHKSRWIPIHPSATLALREYCEFRDRRRLSYGRRSFLQTESGALTYEMVAYAFRRIRERLGWTERPRIPLQRDLRHTFCVRALIRWYKEGANIDQRIAALSTYLGHSNVADTYWYLTAVPELLEVTGDRFERYVTGKEAS